MPNMWELPPIENKRKHDWPILKLRHSITTTDYTVLVFSTSFAPGAGKLPVKAAAARHMALTGLTRKILERVIPRG